MARIDLDHKVMRCFEDAAGVLKNNPDAPVDCAALASVLMEMGEAICVQLEKNRRDLLASQARLEHMLEVHTGAADYSQPPAPQILHG